MITRLQTNLFGLFTCTTLVGDRPKAIEDNRLRQKEILTAQEFLDISSSMSDNLTNEMNPLALATGMTCTDTFHLNQMLKQPDKEDFIKALDKK